MPEPFVSYDGTTLYVEHSLSPPFVARLIAQLKTTPKIESVFFKNCPGGNYAASKALAKTIRARRLNTVAEGYVFSGCQLAYMAGTHRKIGPANEVYFGVHAPFRRDGGASEAVVIDELLNLQKLYSDGKFPGRFEPAIRAYARGEPGLILRRVAINNTSAREDAYFCDSVDIRHWPQLAKCGGFQAISLHSFGFVTAPQ